LTGAIVELRQAAQVERLLVGDLLLVTRRRPSQWPIELLALGPLACIRVHGPARRSDRTIQADMRRARLSFGCVLPVGDGASIDVLRPRLKLKRIGRRRTVGVLHSLLSARCARTGGLISRGLCRSAHLIASQPFAVFFA